MGLIAAAFAVSVLAGTGVGGGGLFVIYLTKFAALPQTAAQRLNLIFFLGAAGAALPYHVKHGKISLRLTVFFAVIGLAGAVLGILLRHSLDEKIIRKVFGYFLIFSGIFSLFGKRGSARRGGTE